jgi:zinc-ribbon domain
VYCPSCSSHNQDEVKFCTRCGTNLGVVSDALSGKLASQSQVDERSVTLFKDYYRGRNSVIIGCVASAIALFKVVLFALLGLPVKPDALGVLAGLLLTYGVVALIWGAARWNNAASQIKAIERATSQGASLRSAESHYISLPPEPARIRTGALSNDPIESPVSVTEQTTRHLDERGYAPPVKPGQDQSQ